MKFHGSFTDNADIDSNSTRLYIYIYIHILTVSEQVLL